MAIKNPKYDMINEDAKTRNKERKWIDSEKNSAKNTIMVTVVATNNDILRAIPFGVRFFTKQI